MRMCIALSICIAMNMYAGYETKTISLKGFYIDNNKVHRKLKHSAPTRKIERDQSLSSLVSGKKCGRQLCDIIFSAAQHQAEIEMCRMMSDVMQQAVHDPQKIHREMYYIGTRSVMLQGICQFYCEQLPYDILSEKEDARKLVKELRRYYKQKNVVPSFE